MMKPVPRLIDPFELDELHLPLPALEYLAEHGGVPVTPASPFGFILSGGPRCSAAEREIAGQDLVGRGILQPEGSAASDAIRAGAGAASHYAKALHVLAQPQIQLRVAVVAPPKEPTRLSLFLRDGWAAAGGVDGETFRVGAAVDANLVPRLLARHAAGKEPAADLRGIFLWPSQISLLTAIWPGQGKQAHEPVSAAAATTALARAGVSGEAAAAALRALSEAGIVGPAGDELGLQHPFRFWLALIWSGQYCELVATALTANNGGEPRQSDSSRRLLFVGPRGRRAHCQRLSGDDLTAALLTLGADPAPEHREDELVALAFLAEAVTTEMIRGLMRSAEQQ
ncbi:MAG: hypothetical protein HYV63_13980 [Candidatus Schekmanbacteria bacterium]|nr:hypothetical protein [Candidatus Schekmanbacteria bacterium]